MHKLNKFIIILFLIICGGWNCFLKAQTVVIPDANFATWLQTNVPSAMSGNLLDTTNILVTTSTQTISVNSLSISNIYGVQFFKSLTCLRCDYNQLISLPPLPATLQNLSTVSNSLTSLPTLPSSLIFLQCNVNHLNSIPPLPNSLKVLDCEWNNLTNLPTLSPSLITLICNYNHINILPVLPNTLIDLSCYTNSLTALPLLPPTLKNLFCTNNKITSLPVLPNTLSTLACSNNILISLPNLPQSIKQLYCSNNQLNSLPTLPDSLVLLACNNNNISCFPTFPNTIKTIPNYFNISNNPYTCLPNYINAMDAATLATPLCVDGNCPPVIDVISDILIPNVFTPNNDSINDVWRFSLGKDSHLKNLSVFNRWGNLIDINTRTSVSEINWDGRTTSGEPSSVGVYFYVLQYTDAKGNEYKKNGYITLIR